MADNRVNSNLSQTAFGPICQVWRLGRDIGGNDCEGSNPDLSGTYFQHGDYWFEFLHRVSGKTENKSYSYIEYLRISNSIAVKKLEDEAQRAARTRSEIPRSAFARYTSLIRQPGDACTHRGSQTDRRPSTSEHVRPEQQEAAEDMWGSPDLYFRPIKPAQEEIKPVQENTYPDGASFAINGNWDRVDFKQNKQGQLYIECDDGKRKIYQLYRSTSELLGSAHDRNCGPHNRFDIRFEVKQNDKSCQTDNFTINNMLDKLLNEKTVEDNVVVSADEHNNNGSIWNESWLRELWVNVPTEQVGASDIEKMREELNVEGKLLLTEIYQQIECGANDTVDVAKVNETRIDEASVNLQRQIRVSEDPRDLQNNIPFVYDCILDLLRWLNLIKR